MLDRSNRVIGHIAILDDKPMDADSRAIGLVKIFASRAAAELKRQKAEDDLQAALQEVQRLNTTSTERICAARRSRSGLNVRGNCRCLEAAEGRSFSDCQSGSDRFHSLYHWRDWHGKGTHRTRCSQAIQEI